MRELKDGSTPAKAKAGRRKGTLPAGGRAMLEELAHGVAQCMQLRSRNAELAATVERRDVALNMFARIMAYKEPACDEDKRSACQHKDVQRCAECWLQAIDKAAVQWLAKRRKEAGEQQRGTA